MPDAQLSRRDFLKTGGALVVTFTLAPQAVRAQGSRWPTKSVALDEVASFLAIDGNGMVTLYSGKVELGTGAITALSQIAAEELGVPLDRVTTIQGDTALTPAQGPTYASLTIQIGGMQIRRAAATARETLLGLAARRLNVEKDELAINAGVVTAKAGGKGLSYGQLVGDRTFTVKVNPSAPLKDPKDYTIVGKPIARLDIPAKIFGTFTFVQDVKVPGMVHARVIHPAAVGAKLESWNDSACRKIPGYMRAVQNGD
jgi:CO/xanthine dehydrogenase Mo-binding subunit